MRHENDPDPADHNRWPGCGRAAGARWNVYDHMRPRVLHHPVLVMAMIFYLIKSIAELGALALFIATIAVWAIIIAGLAS